MKNHDTRRFNHFQRLLRGGSSALVAALLLAALGPIGSIEFAAAADRYWDATAGAGNGVGGDGTWQAQSGIFPTWSTTSAGDAVLVNAATTDAGIFQGTAGTIVISGTPFTLASWTFNTTNYTIRTNNMVTRVLNGPWSLAANVNLNMGVTTTTTDVNMNIVGSISGGSGSKLTIRGGQDSNAAMRVNLSAVGSTISVPIEIIEVGDGMAGVAAINTGVVTSNTITNNSTGTTMLGATGANDLTVNGVISGTAAVRFEGDLFAGGMVNLGAQSNYTGNSVVNISYVKLGVNNALSTSSALQFINGNLDMNGKNQTVTSLASLTGGAQSISNFSGSPLSTFTIQGSATTTYSGSIGTGVANNIALALSSAHTGILVLSGGNNYTGATTISGGELRLSGIGALPGGTDTAVGAGESALTLNGGVLGLAAGNFTRALGTGAGQVQFTADGGFAAYGADRLVNLGGATATVTWGSGNFVPAASKLIVGTADATHTLIFQNPIDLSAGTRTVQVNDGSAVVEANLSGALSNGGLTKTGDGTLVLSGTNSYAGVTTLRAGILSVSTIGNGGVSGNLGAASGAAANLVFDDGTLQYTGATASTDRNFTINVDKTATFDITTNNLTVSGASTATNGALNKTGAGTLTLSGANTYTGGTTLAAGTLSLGSAGAIGTTGSILFTGGTLQYTASNTADYSSRFDPSSYDYRIDTNGQNVTFATPLTGFAGLTKIGGGTIYLTADNTYTGGTTVGNQGVYIGNGGPTGSITGNVTVSGGTLGFNRSNAMTFAGTITGAGAVLQAGSGTTTLTGNNTYTDGTHLVDGTLSLGSSGAIGNAGPIYFLGGTLQYSASNTFDYSSRLEAYADCRIDTNGQNITFASPIAAFAGLTKLGGGSLVLTNANTYSGGTVVNSGQLLVNNVSGSGTGTGAVEVNSGGTLGGTGSISGAVTVHSGGHVAPGASIESLAVGSLTLNTGSILDFDLGAPGSPGINNDLINVTVSGDLTLSGGSVALTNAGGLAIGTYTLIDYVGTLGGIVANLGTPTGPAGFSYALLNNLSNTSIDLTVSLLGDYNHNNVVDAADYVLWRKNPASYGGSPGGYDVWRSHFGQTPGSGTGAIASAAVPEPASAWLLIVGTVVATWRVRRIASNVH